MDCFAPRKFRGERTAGVEQFEAFPHEPGRHRAHHEHRLVVETAIEIGHKRGLQVIAGAGSNCTRHAVELQKLAFDLGADAGLQVSPYYNKPSQEGLYRHFMTVADSCPLPVMRCSTACA